MRKIVLLVAVFAAIVLCNSQKQNPCPAGECVPFYQCENGSIITDGKGILDIRLGEENPCSDTFQTCCTLKSDTNIIKTPRVNVGCGIRNAEGVGFSITGANNNEAQFAEFPWMIAVLKVEKISDGQTANVYLCGGSLIHPSVVLTAAHCVNQSDPQILKIRAGEWDTQSKSELIAHQNRQIRNYVIHPEYYSRALYNDVALLFLTEPVDIAGNVNTICLPQQGEIFDGSRCLATGWGKDKFGTQGQYQNILKNIELPIVSKVSCLNSLRTTRLGKYFRLHQSFICAGGELGKDTCTGDGGSPVVCPIKDAPGRYAQAGIVAWGIECNNEIPGVYVNVPLFRDWIDEHMRLQQFSTSNYEL